MNMYKKVMVAIDGSKESEAAYKKALRLTDKINDELVLVHVVDTRALQTITSFDSLLVTQAAQAAQSLLDSYKQQAIADGGKRIKTLVEYGSPKHCIATDLPQEHHIDLIVLGSTGLNAVERLFIGSVSEYVARHASCDVLIVRISADTVANKRTGS